MTSRVASLAALVLLAASGGCTAMCQSPWDYCNAVIGPGGCPDCDFGARYGSAFHPMDGTPPTTPREPAAARPESVPYEPYEDSYGDFDEESLDEVGTYRGYGPPALRR